MPLLANYHKEGQPPCHIGRTAVLSCFQPLRRSTTSDFPAVDVSHVGIE